jgi:transposase
MSTPRKPYPGDVTDEEWAFVAPYLTLMTPTAPQRRDDLREGFNGLRYPVRTGSQWRYLPHDFPPWEAVYQPAQRRLAAGRFAAMADDLRALGREAAGREPQPTAAILDGRTRQSTPESGHRAGCGGHNMRNGSKLPAAVDPLGHLLVARSTPANDQERAQVAELADEVQAVAGTTVETAFVDRGFTGAEPAEAAADDGIEVVVERSFAWAARFRRLAKDDERLPETVVGLHSVAFACLMLHRAVPLLGASP